LIGTRVPERPGRMRGRQTDCVHARGLGGLDADRGDLEDDRAGRLDALTDRGVRLAIGSSGARANLELTVRECGLDGRFAAIAALEDITRGKPDPQVFLVASARSGIEPARSIVFEDAPVGIQAAKAAGMYAVGLTTSHPARALWDAGADEVVENLVGYNVSGLIGRIKDRHP
ncbi:MAG: HAD family hydrolase, partial [Isosphaeraceae bacterium]